MSIKYSTVTSPCAACKFLRRKCVPECVFAPYFPADQPSRFSTVHKVFGASNVAKILNELAPENREDAVNSLVYEAETRTIDPVYGCVGVISLMQQNLRNLKLSIEDSKNELASLVGPQAAMEMLQDPYLQAKFQDAAGAASSSDSGQIPVVPYMAQMAGQGPVIVNDLQARFQQQQILQQQLIHQQIIQQQIRRGGGQLVIREPQQELQQQEGQLVIGDQQQQLQQQQIALAQLEALRQMEEEQYVAAMRASQQQQQLDMMMRYEQQQFAKIHAQKLQQQHEMIGYHGHGGAQYGHMGAGPSNVAAMSPMLELGTGFDAGNSYHIQQQQQQQETLLMLQQPQQIQQQQQQQETLLILQQPQHFQQQQQETLLMLQQPQEIQQQQETLLMLQQPQQIQQQQEEQDQKLFLDLQDIETIRRGKEKYL